MTKRTQSTDTDDLPPVAKTRPRRAKPIAKATTAKPPPAPAATIPPAFVSNLASIGFRIAECERGFYMAHKDLITASEMWEKALPFIIKDLAGVSVGLTYVAHSMPNDELYRAPLRDPPVDNEEPTHHLEEVWRHICAKSGGRMANPFQKFADAGAALPLLVQELMDPPDSCPLSQAAPDGAYMVTLKLFFKNLWLHLRIHRKRSV